MATYSRSQTTTQTSQSAAMPSMDISSLLVKTMENVMNDKETGDKDFEKIITDAINNSDLLKDKTKDDTNKELTDLLKDKKNSDKELSNLLKDSNKEKKDSSAGKIVSTGVIAATVGAMFKTKSLGGAISGAGRAAGGLVSGIGNIGGSAIAGVGKLFGPVGAIVGKAVGTAVATPFKIVGGTITAAIGGLGKLLNMPLKELVTKGTLIVGVLSQLFVFLEGLMAKFIAEKDIKWIDFMSKLKGSIAVIPDRIGLMLRQVLSDFGIGRGGLSKSEEKEYEKIKKQLNKTDEGYALKNFFNENDTAFRENYGIENKEEFLKNYNLTDAKSVEQMRQDLITRGVQKMSDSERQMAAEMGESPEQYITEGLAPLFENLQSALKEDTKNNENRAVLMQRLNELESKKQNIDVDAAQKEIDEKEEKYSNAFFVQDASKYADKQGGLTEFQQEYIDEIRGEGMSGKVKQFYATTRGKELETKDATGAERFLKNQYKDWTDAWSKMFKDFKQDIGINITQKQDIPNPEFYRQ